MHSCVVLHLDPLHHGAEIVAEVQAAGRLHAGEDARLESHVHLSLEPARVMARAGGERKPGLAYLPAITTERLELAELAAPVDLGGRRSRRQAGADESGQRRRSGTRSLALAAAIGSSTSAAAMKPTPMTRQRKECAAARRSRASPSKCPWARAAIEQQRIHPAAERGRDRNTEMRHQAEMPEEEEQRRPTRWCSRSGSRPRSASVSSYPGGRRRPARTP